MDKTQIQDVSVMLIANAGDAYGHFNQAIACARKGDFEAADAEIAAGRTSIAAAHKSQLELLAAEGKGNELDLSLLLVHAQDHLMMAMSFENVAREFITLYRERSAS